MKKNNWKILFISFLTWSWIVFLPSLSNGSDDLSEALLEEDVPHLTNMLQTQYSDKLKKRVSLYECPPQRFKELFQHTDFGNNNYLGNKSFFVGKVKGNNGSGTGTIVEGIKETEDALRLVGITALHNFVVVKSGNIKHITKNSDKFWIGNITSNEDDQDEALFGKVLIDKITVQQIISKDICLFEGYFDREKAFESNHQYYDTAVYEGGNYFPKFVREEISKGFKQEDCTIYHYPHGVSHQRVNIGNIDGADKDLTGKHQIRTLSGSSGASIFNQNFEIVGIHIAASMAKEDLIDDKIVKTDDKHKDVLVTKYNRFVKISEKDYNDLKTGQVLFDAKNVVGTDGINRPVLYKVIDFLW